MLQNKLYNLTTASYVLKIFWVSTRINILYVYRDFLCMPIENLIQIKTVCHFEY